MSEKPQNAAATQLYWSSELANYTCSICLEPIGTRPAAVIVPVTDNESWQQTLFGAFTGIIVHDVCLPKDARP